MKFSLMKDYFNTVSLWTTHLLITKGLIADNITKKKKKKNS